MQKEHLTFWSEVRLEDMQNKTALKPTENLAFPVARALCKHVAPRQFVQQGVGKPAAYCKYRGQYWYGVVVVINNRATLVGIRHALALQRFCFDVWKFN